MESHSIGRYHCPNPGCPVKPRPLFARTDSIRRHCGLTVAKTKTLKETKDSRAKSLACKPFFKSRRKSEYCIHPVPYYLSCELHKIRKPDPWDPLYDKYLELSKNPPQPCDACRERFELEKLKGLDECERIDRRRVNHRK